MATAPPLPEAYPKHITQMEANMALNNTTTPKTATPLLNRGDYITLQAMIYAVACIQKLPEDRQERSSMVDMCATARRMGGGGIAHYLWSVEHHVGYEIDLWPAYGGDDPSGLYTDEETATRDTVRAWIDDHDAQFRRTLALKDAPPSNVVKFLDGPDDMEGEAA